VGFFWVLFEEIYEFLGFLFHELGIELMEMKFKFGDEF
jgi:hypothetical protein